MTLKNLDKSFSWEELIKFAEYLKDEVLVYENLIQTIELIKKSESDVHGSDETKPHELGNFDTVFDIVCFYKCNVCVRSVPEVRIYESILN